MSAPLWHRRRIERLAQLLDEASGGRRQRIRSPHDEELGEYVAIRNHLAETPPPEVDPDFRAGLRTMLVAAAERQAMGDLPEPEPSQPRRTRRPARIPAQGPRARTALITGVTVGAVAFAGMSTASANAVPGDALYGVKRSTERAQLALAGSDVGRAQLYLDFARTRLAEAGTVTSGLDRVLDDMDLDTTAGISLLTTAATNRHDPTALDPIEPFVTEQRQALSRLAQQVRGDDRERVEDSLDLLRDVTQRAETLRYHLGNGCQSAASVVDEFGPNPETCFTLPAPDALGPPLSSSSIPQQGQPETGETLPGYGQPGGGSNATGDDSPEPPSDQNDDPDSALAPDEDQPEEQPSDDETDEGLLNDLNRLLGDLLGGR